MHSEVQNSETYNGYIYITTNLLNGVRYIGQKKGDFNPEYFGSGIHLKRAVNKYGRSFFNVEPLETVVALTKSTLKQELDEREKYYIAKYDAVNSDKFYNIADGGQGGYLGEEVQKKRTASQTGKKYSEERCRHMSEGSKGRACWSKGLTKETSPSLMKTSEKLKYRVGGLNPNSKEIRCIETGVIYDSIKDAEETLHLYKIGRHINGHRKSVGGLHFEKI